jgi:ankyrin repeat protein
MVEGSLIKAAEAGSADAALYLAIFYTNVHFNSAKACDYMRRAAELGSSSAMYLCYRFYKAHGIQLPFLDTQLITWFHAGICWGSQVAYEDGKEAMGYPGVIWAGKIFLQLQGSFYGDTPFRAAEAAGPFNIMRDDFATTMDTIRSLNQHIDDFTIAGGNGDKLLHWAAAMHGVPLQEHKGLLKDLLTRGQANPNVRNAKGETPLLVAMRARNLQAVVELLQHEADPSLASDSGQVPLHWLWTFPDYRQGSEEDEKGVKQFAAALSGGSRQNPLYDATDAVADAVATRVNDSWEADRVMRLQAHVFSELPAGTPLHWAVKRRSIATVKALLAVGAKSSTCAYGAKSVAGTSETHLLSAFHLAAAMHDDDILELFVEAEPDVLQELVPCPLAVAIDGNASNGYANGRIERMMRHGASYQTRAKRTFEWFWRKNYCKLGKGFDQNSPDMTGRPCTPLILAVQSGQVDIVEALLNTPFRSSLEIKGGLANWSPLQESIKQRCDEAYFLLRRHGASISSYTNIDEGGVMNNLVLVAEFGHNRLDVAKDLIYAGVSVVAEQPMNKPPLLVAIAGGSFPLARLLLDNGADPNELRGCVCDIHRLDSGAIDVPTTVFGCLLLQFGHHKLLPLIWILDEYMAGRLAKPLQTIVCPKTGFNIFHQLGFCQERGRDDDVIISAFQKLRAAFPDTSLLNGVAIAHESKMLGHLRLTPLYLAVDVCNARLVRKMLDDGADPSADLGGGLTVLQHGRKVLAEFEGYLATAVLPEWLTPADAAEIPEMLTRRKEIVELLERKEIRSIGQPVDLAVMCNKTRRLFIQSSDES